MDARKTQTRDPPMGQLGAELFALRKADGRGATVFLGNGASAASNVPSWHDLALRVCNEFEVTCDHANPLPGLYKYLQAAGRGSQQRRYLAFGESLGGHKHSLGYEHLAQLASEGYVSTILTTNWDCLLETAFYRHMPAERLRFLTRGVVSDKVIAGALEYEYPRQVIVVKLHGDLASRVFLLRPEEVSNFEPELEVALSHKLNVPTYVVGSSLNDLDVLRTLISTKRSSTLYHVRYDKKAESEIANILTNAGAIEISGKRKVVIRTNEEANVGDFDHFFTQLNLAVHLRQNNANKPKLKELEDSILQKEQRGLRYLSNAHIQELLDPFFKKIQRFKPDITFFINDPTAPGGLELKRRILHRLEKEKLFSEDIGYLVLGVQELTNGRLGPKDPTAR